MAHTHTHTPLLAHTHTHTHTHSSSHAYTHLYSLLSTLSFSLSHTHTHNAHRRAALPPRTPTLTLTRVAVNRPSPGGGPRPSPSLDPARYPGGGRPSPALDPARYSGGSAYAQKSPHVSFSPLSHARSPSVQFANVKAGGGGGGMVTPFSPLSGPAPSPYAQIKSLSGGNNTHSASTNNIYSNSVTGPPLAVATARARPATASVMTTAERQGRQAADGSDQPALVRRASTQVPLGSGGGGGYRNNGGSLSAAQSDEEDDIYLYDESYRGPGARGVGPPPLQQQGVMYSPQMLPAAGNPYNISTTDGFATQQAEQTTPRIKAPADFFLAPNLFMSPRLTATYVNTDEARMAPSPPTAGKPQPSGRTQRIIRRASIEGMSVSTPNTPLLGAASSGGGMPFASPMMRYQQHDLEQMSRQGTASSSGGPRDTDSHSSSRIRIDLPLTPRGDDDDRVQLYPTPPDHQPQNMMGRSAQRPATAASRASFSGVPSRKQTAVVPPIVTVTPALNVRSPMLQPSQVLQLNSARASSSLLQAGVQASGSSALTPRPQTSQHPHSATFNGRVVHESSGSGQNQWDDEVHGGGHEHEHRNMHRRTTISGTHAASASDLVSYDDVSAGGGGGGRGGSRSARSYSFAGMFPARFPRMYFFCSLP